MAIYFTADWHLGERRLDILQRPFANAEAQTEAMLWLHNQIVKPEDTLIFVGDAAFDPDFLKEVARFNGKKTIIKGNHDRKVTDDDLAKYFEKIVPEGEGIEMEYEGIPLYVTHYPTQAKTDRFNLVGHIHGAWKVQLNMLNVGVDVHHFKPMPIENIPFFHKAISEFYDKDVWCYNHIANSTYEPTRGKKTRYLDIK